MVDLPPLSESVEEKINKVAPRLRPLSELPPRELVILRLSPEMEIVSREAKIIRGAGGATAYFAHHKARVEWIIRMPIWPGTLNVFVDGLFHLIDPWEGIEPDPFLTLEEKRKVICTVNDVPGLILRTHPHSNVLTEFEIVCCDQVQHGGYETFLTVRFENRRV